jgi:hypothetical protein
MRRRISATILVSGVKLNGQKIDHDRINIEVQEDWHKVRLSR